MENHIKQTLQQKGNAIPLTTFVFNGELDDCRSSKSTARSIYEAFRS